MPPVHQLPTKLFGKKTETENPPAFVFPFHTPLFRLQLPESLALWVPILLFHQHRGTNGRPDPDPDPPTSDPDGGVCQMPERRPDATLTYGTLFSEWVLRQFLPERQRQQRSPATQPQAIQRKILPPSNPERPDQNDDRRLSLSPISPISPFAVCVRKELTVHQ